jgi:hypothetical protein
MKIRNIWGVRMAAPSFNPWGGVLKAIPGQLPGRISRPLSATPGSGGMVAVPDGLGAFDWEDAISTGQKFLDSAASLKKSLDKPKKPSVPAPAPAPVQAGLFGGMTTQNMLILGGVAVVAALLFGRRR